MSQRSDYCLGGQRHTMLATDKWRRSDGTRPKPLFASFGPGIIAAFHVAQSETVQKPPGSNRSKLATLVEMVLRYNPAHFAGSGCGLSPNRRLRVGAGGGPFFHEPEKQGGQ